MATAVNLKRARVEYLSTLDFIKDKYLEATYGLPDDDPQQLALWQWYVEASTEAKRIYRDKIGE